MDISNHSHLISAACSAVAQEQWHEAALAYAKLSLIFPNEADVHYLHGRTLMAAGQLESALHQFDLAIHLDAESPAYYRSRGDALQEIGNYRSAVSSYRYALKLSPGDVDAMINLGNAFNRQDRPDQALLWYKCAYDYSPENAVVMNNIGKTIHDHGDLWRARKWYEKALQVDPNYAEARFNRSVLMLAQGDYMNGWAEYEWRFKRKSAHRIYPHQLDTRRWDGKNLMGKRILVHCEQGMGDVIQFCRFLPMLKRMGGEVVAEVHPPLVSLLHSMPEIDEVIPFNPKRPPECGHDMHISLLSLPFLLGITLDRVSSPVPYLKPSLSNVDFWKFKAAIPDGFRVGVVWAGSSIDPRRACPLSFMQTLSAALPDVHFFSLQKDLSSRSDLERLGNSNINHWGNRFNDFSTTAAAISHLHLVISIDTAVAHLAGAMGKPVFILLPYIADWRWLQAGEKNPWYPTARLFRQFQKNNWAGILPLLIDAIRKESQAAAYKKSIHEDLLRCEFNQ